MRASPIPTTNHKTRVGDSIHLRIRSLTPLSSSSTSPTLKPPPPPFKLETKQNPKKTHPEKNNKIMGRSSSASERLSQQLRLEIKTPSFFRCPISLEVMRSPVSLCTGVTYDRRSIQRWLDSGNTTCPATMIPLPSTDLVPNLTLRRLINVWSKGKDDFAPADLSSEGEKLAHLEKLAAFFEDCDVDDSVKNAIFKAGDFVNIIVSVVLNEELNLVGAGLKVVSLILSLDCIEEGNKQRLISALCSKLDLILKSLTSVLKDSKGEPIKNSLRILQILLSTPETKNLEAEKLDALIPGLIAVINGCPSAINESLGCLIQLLTSKRALKAMVQAKIVPALIRILSPESNSISSKSTERAIIILEASVNCSAGRSEIMEMVEDCVEVVMWRMMKVGREGREAAVGVLWSVCFGSGGDPKAKEAVAAVAGGMAKILVVMQGDCSPAVRRMAGDLLRVFWVDKKSLVAGYDTKTTHIMPF